MEEVDGVYLKEGRGMGGILKWKKGKGGVILNGRRGVFLN